MKAQDQLEDHLLVLQCQEGNRVALEQLIDRWQDRLWRHACRLCGDEQAAWDALQEAWIAIARGIHRLEEAGAFPAWAYRITSNKCRDWVRREGRRRQRLQAYAEEAAVPEAPGASGFESVSEALAHLSGPDQAILALRYLDGFTVPDVARILGIPAGTVKSRLHSARMRLRTELEESQHE
jgi:RNA polymerase sigma-70 factor (ECF subfamily)